MERQGPGRHTKKVKKLYPLVLGESTAPPSKTNSWLPEHPSMHHVLEYFCLAVMIFIGVAKFCSSEEPVYSMNKKKNSCEICSWNR